LIYLLDANAVSDWLGRYPNEMDVLVAERLRGGDNVSICQPVYYELLRGLLWRKAPRKAAQLQAAILPKLVFIRVIDDDWIEAARLWAMTRSAGRQLSDVDLLLAAITRRVSGVIVSNDADFDALPVQREDWRELF
jgi:predicted nucleic acid-binding protein